MLFATVMLIPVQGHQPFENIMRSRLSWPSKLLSRTYVTRPSRLSRPPEGFQASNTPEPSTSASPKIAFQQNNPPSAASLYDALDQIPAGSEAPLLYRQPAVRNNDQKGQEASILSADQKQQLQLLRSQGHSVSSLARQFGFSRSQVMRSSFPRNPAGQLAKKQLDGLRQVVDVSNKAKWGWNKW